MAFTELRIYEVLDGKMDAWAKLMEEEIIPFQESLVPSVQKSHAPHPPKQ
ncbi:MAG: hypothetical protein KC451_09790 [Amylibacter sp.]|nr:hypothetical protein [Amylibacter sp.]